MKKLLYFGLILMVSCKPEVQQHENKSTRFVDKTLDFVIDNKDNEIVELPRLYDSLAHGLPEQSKLILAEKLEQRGFKLLDSGRGNCPPLGPRIVSKTYQKGDCFCEVSKLYYFTTVDDYYEMSERISCADSTTYFNERKAYFDEVNKKSPK